MEKNSKEKTLEEIYKEAKLAEGPVKDPPQIDISYYQFILEKESTEELGILLKEYEKYKNALRRI